MNMASLVLLTLVITSLLVSVNGQHSDTYFTQSVPVDYYQRVSLNDCPSRFYSSPPNAMGGSAANGQRAKLGEFQHMAAIGWTTNGTTEYRCGGTLISSKFVLTAFHCTIDLEGNAPDTVRLGDTNLDDGLPPLRRTDHLSGDNPFGFYKRDDDKDDDAAQQINIRAIRKHPLHQPGRKYHDIALMELESEARFDQATCSACLWLEKEVPPEEMVAVGFGATGAGESRSSTLQKLKLSAIDKKSCAERIASSLSISKRTMPDGLVNEQFCAGNDTVWQDTCEGDSGGPIQVDRADVDATETPLVVGIVSFGTRCTPGSFGVYTRIASYREWIEQEIQQPVDYITCTRMSSCRSRKRLYGISPADGNPLVRVGLLWESSEGNHFQCAATLIDYRFALTSAFCAQEKRGPPKYIVVVSTGEMVEIDSVIIHPQFMSGRHANDVALLKLAKFLNPNNDLRPACLSKEKRKSEYNHDYWHYSAYGARYDRKERRKNIYQEYFIQPASGNKGDCTTLEHKQDNITCRKNPTNLIPTMCNIDHGGPVYITHPLEPIPYLHGLAPDLREECNGDLLVINVSPHVEWIERVVLDH